MGTEFSIFKVLLSALPGICGLGKYPVFILRCLREPCGVTTSRIGECHRILGHRGWHLGEGLTLVPKAGL